MKQRNEHKPARIASAAFAAAAIACFLSANAQAPAAAGALVGNAERGAKLFSDTYNCYACHGFDAQTGERRLVPMKYTQEGFIAFVNRSPLPQMPAFVDASAQDLADIYAYIRTIPEDAPKVSDVPLLKDILDRKMSALGKN
jgi:mono/diheme cytochrome c family protein